MTDTTEQQVYLVGGGIAALAAAVLLVRDAEVRPSAIHIFEYLPVAGGSLDGSGDAEHGYLVRGGRMFEEHFGCTFDLLRDIPTLEDPQRSVTDDIKAFTREIVTSSNCRLVIDGERQEAPLYQLSLKDKLDLLRLTRRAEARLQGVTIEQYFSPHFFETNFWIMWCTMFAFQSWHSVIEMRRYMLRFMHLLPGFNRLEGIHRTRFNQYDSIVAPVVHWLQQRGVQLHLNCAVKDVEFNAGCSRIDRICFADDDARPPVDVRRHDRVLVTLGSMTEDSTTGGMQAPPAPATPVTDGAWPLWRRIAERSPQFGRPQVFAGDQRQTQWLSFTVTLQDDRFFRFMQDFTGNAAGTGGLVTFKHSGWLLSVVLARQPHFANQPDDVYVFWGYGLHPAGVGDRVAKPMLQCTGEEILDELAHQLRLGDDAGAMFATANCIPCLMPHITTQFMPRETGDRPQVRPPGAENFAFLGQFVELPEDTVFTVEYSVRSAQVAVNDLFDTGLSPTPLYRGFEAPRVIRRALGRILANGKA